MTRTRDDKGRFLKGQCGNRKGRPKRELTELRAHLATVAPDILGRLVDLALDGDVAACKAVLDRVLPPLRATTAPVAVSVPPGAGLAGAARAFVAAAAEGRITTDDAQAMLQALAAAAKVIEVSDLEQRITALEGQSRERT